MNKHNVRSFGIIFLLFSSFFVSCNSTAQSLNSDRIAAIKAATVRITVDSTDWTGTGFFINENGTLLTCLHVIRPAFGVNSVKKIFIETNAGERFEATVPNNILNSQEYIKSATIFDFIELHVTPSQNKKFKYLNLGSYKDLQEGDEVYTCGYPLSIKQQFISQGIVSTKYQDTITYLLYGNPVDKHLRNQSLLDLTLNVGNSGGAIIKLGKTVKEDRVVGIANFIIIPYGQAVQEVKMATQNTQTDVKISGISTMGAYNLFSSALAQASNGISGCVSIEYYLQAQNAQSK